MPAGTVTFKDTDCDPPGGRETLVWLSVEMTLEGEADDERLMVPEKEFDESSVIVDVAEDPCSIVRLVGFEEIE